MALEKMIPLMLEGIRDTMYMTTVSTLFAYLLGLPLAILLVLTAPKGLRPQPIVYRVLDAVVNVFRSIPFLILIGFQLVACIRAWRAYKATKDGEANAEREQLAAERAETLQMMEELQRMRAELEAASKRTPATQRRKKTNETKDENKG